MIAYLRFLAGRERSEEADRHLGLTLAFVAGAVNAGGFLAVATYTSHMTGILSSLADNLALGHPELIATGAAAFASFVAGAATSGWLAQWARARRLRSEHALPLALEAALLLAFGLLGARLGRLPPLLLLCYLMGLQNAIITRLSGARIRTTHMTGNATDLGMELGRLLHGDDPDAPADRRRMRVHAELIAAFVSGGFAGALGFKRAGFAAALPIAALVLAIAAAPVWDDLGL